MRVGSLFSGIGGLDLGLERAGMSVAWQCEIDPYCRAVLAHHWPGVKCYDDIRAIDDTAERVDLICGGFPCQPVSLAGKGLAQEDPRWLWPEFARVVGVLRPRYVLVENVPGLVRRGLADVIGDLAALGYDAEWEIVSAAACGAPHLRERIFVVAYRNGSGVEARICDGVRAESPIGAGQPPCEGREGRTGTLADSRYFTEENWREELANRSRGARDNPGADVADATGGRWSGWPAGIEGDIRVGKEAKRSQSEQVAPRSGDLLRADSDSQTGVSPWAAGEAVFRPEAVERLGRRSCGDGSHWTTEPDVGRVAHGVPNRLAQLRALGNAVVPQVSEAVGRLILEAEGVARAA